MNILSSMLNFIADRLTRTAESITAIEGRLTTAESSLSGVSTRTQNFYVFRFASISGSDDYSVISAALQAILNQNLGDITFVCYIFRTGAWQLNGFGSIRSGDARATFVNGNNGRIDVVNRSTTSALQIIKTYS